MADRGKKEEALQQLQDELNLPSLPKRIDVELRYQPIAYRWAHNLEGYRSTETETFLSFFRAMEPSTSAVVATASRSY